MPPMMKFDKPLKYITIFCPANKNNPDFVKNLLLDYEII
jgi:hypothetical protein